MVGEPVAELDARYSSDGAKPIRWAEAVQHLVAADVYWVTTVRSDGRPHVTPLLSVWLDDVLYFCTGPTEQKAKNLATNSHCVLTTGCNSLDEGVDLVVEGDAVNVRGDAVLRRVAGEYESKYGSEWHFDVGDGAFLHGSGEALVFEVAPSVVYAFGKGDPFTHTRWRFHNDEPGQNRP